MPDKEKDKKASPSSSQEEGAKTEKNLTSKEDGITIDNSQGNEKYGETPYRWYVMIAYCLCVFANGFQWVTF